MIKKFTLLLLAMLCVAGTNAKVQLSLVNLDAGWNAAYNTTAKTITFEEGTYKAKGWTYGESVKSNPYLVVEFANSTDASKVIVSAGDIEPSAETGKSYIICDLSSKGETPISEILIKNKETSAVVTLKDAFLLTASEYEEYNALKTRSVTELDFDFSSSASFENWEGTVIDYDLKTATFSKSNQAFGWKIWGAQTTNTIVFNFDGNQTASILQITYPDGTEKTANYDIESSQKSLFVDLSTYPSINRYMFRGNTYVGSDFQNTTIKFTQAPYYTSLSEDLEKAYLNQQVKATIGSSGYTAFSCDQALDFTDVDGVTAYIVSSTDAENAIMTPVNKVPANTGLVLAGTASTSYWIPTTTGDTEDVSSNLLQCAIDATNVQASEDFTSRYILAKQSGNTGFYKLEEDGSKLVAGTDTKKYHTLSCNKAYLEITTAGARGFMKMSIGGDGNTTGISNTVKESSIQDNIYYSLNGTAVKNPSKGLYIINGKKVIIK